MGISVFPTPSAATKTVKGQAFTSNGNWTAPTGVNYVTVFARGGGGASSSTNNATNGDTYNGSNAGGDTTFGTNLVIARGGNAAPNTSQSASGTATGGRAGTANSGAGGVTGTNGTGAITNVITVPIYHGKDGTQVSATVQVTPGSNYAIAIGAGGSAGNWTGGNGAAGMSVGAGGSGFLSLTWEE